MAAHQAPRPWDSPGKNTSGLPFRSPMLESEKWKCSRSVVSDPQRPHGLQPSRLLPPWDFPGKSTGVWCHCLLCMIIWLIQIKVWAMGLIYSNIYQNTINIINKILHSTLAICVKFKHFLQNNHSNGCKWKCSVVSDSLRPQGLYSPWNSPGQNTGVGSRARFQGLLIGFWIILV